jgi:hypothetical protein
VPPPWFSPPHLHRARSSNPRESRKGLFAHPPSAKLFKTTGEALLRDLMAIQVCVGGGWGGGICSMA